MLSAIYFLTLKGELLIGHYFRNDIPRNLNPVTIFRTRILTKTKLTPIVKVGPLTFLFMKESNVYIIAVTVQNANPTMIFQFMYKVVDCFKAYFHGQLNVHKIQGNFATIYELLEEMMDNGYPQVTALSVLDNYIKVGKMLHKKKSKASDLIKKMTGSLTGSCDWREPDKHFYSRNEVYIDVVESVNLLMSAQKTILKQDVSGKVIMKTFLTGMPQCQLGLNDKLVLEKERKKKGKQQTPSGISIDDVSFHRCVRLGKFDQHRLITFIPPDGRFNLMKYRVTQKQGTQLPFKLTARVVEIGKSRVEFTITIKSQYPRDIIAPKVTVSIPTPENTSNTKIKLNRRAGKAKYKPETASIVWKIRKFPGMTSFILQGASELHIGVSDKPWSRPPITLDFTVPMFAASQFHVRHLNIEESKGQYKTYKWVRYLTKSGSYAFRI